MVIQARFRSSAVALAASAGWFRWTAARRSARGPWSARTPIVLFLVWLAANVPPGTLRGDTFRFLGMNDQNWGNGLSWENGIAPPADGGNGTSDVLVRGPGGTARFDDFFNNPLDWHIRSLTFESQATGGWNHTGGKLFVSSITNNDTNTHSFGNEEIGLAAFSNTITAASGDLDFNTLVFLELDDANLTVNGGQSVFFDGGISGLGFASPSSTLTISGGTFVRIGDSSPILDTIMLSSGTLQLNAASVLDDEIDVSVGSSATFQLNGFNADIGQLTGSGAVSLGAATLTLGDSGSFTFSGAIGGSGGLTKNGTGVLTLGGANTYTGSTSITAGTLQLGNSTTDGSLGDTDVSISSGATFDVNGVTDSVDSISGAGTILLGGGVLVVDEQSGTRTFSGAIQESGELQKSGAGTLVLSGNNTFTLLDINNGIVQVSSQGNLGSGTIELSAGQLQGTASFTNARAITANGTGAINVNTSVTWTQSGVVSGTGSLTKEGNGTLALSASNTYTGDTIINDGVLEITGSNRIGDSSDVTLVAGATFDLNNFSETVSSISGTGGNVDTGGSSGQLTVNASSGTLTYGGTLSGSGIFNKAGAHTLLLSAANSLSGTVNVNAGILRFSGAGSLATGTDVTVANGATWDLSGLSDSVESISGAGSVLLGGGTLTVGDTTGTHTFSGVMSGTGGSLIKSGAHTLVLSGANTYTGTTTIDAGVLQISSSSNLGSGGIIFDTGTLATTGTLTNSRNLTINSANSATIDVMTGTTLTQSASIVGASNTSLIKNGAGTFRLAAPNGTFTGDVTVNAGTLEIGPGAGDALTNSTLVTVNAGGTLLVSQPEDLGGLAGAGSVIANSNLHVGFDDASTTFSGVISGTGGFGKDGLGTLTLSGSNTYAGVTSISNGVLRLSGSGRLPDVSDMDVSSTFDMNGISDAIDALLGSGNVVLGAGTLTVGSNSGTGSFSGVISGTGNLVKTGSGLQGLTGMNAYTGTTSVQGGKLQISSSNNLGSGMLLLANGGTLELTGTTTNSRAIDLGTGGGTLDVNSGQTLTQSGVVSGLGGLTKADTGTLVLSAGNTYTGETTITGGVLRLVGSGGLSISTDVVVSAGATFDLNGISEGVDSISGAGSIMLGGATLTVIEGGGTRTFSGVISGPGGIRKAGTHTLALTGANTFVGSMSIQGGAIAVGLNQNLGDLSNGVTLSNGALQATGSFSSARNLSLSGTGTVDVVTGVNLDWTGIINGSGQLQKSGPGSLSLSGANTYSGGTLISGGSLGVSANSALGPNSGGVILAGGALQALGSFTNLHEIQLINTGTITVNSGFTLTQSAGITGTGDLTKNGTGTLLLTTPATHSGNTVVEAGVLRFGSGALPDLFDVTVNAPGVWDLNGVDDTIDGLFGDGSVQLVGARLTLGAADDCGVFTGVVQGPGEIEIIGLGEHVLAGANTHTATFLNGGILQVAADNNLGVGGAPVSFGGGALHATATFTMARDVTLNPSGGTFNVDGATTLTLANPVSGSGGLTKTGLGTLLLQAIDNSYLGVTDVQAGLLQLAGRLETGGLSGSGHIELGLNELMVNGSGVDEFGGIISGIGGKLIKDGPGTLTLSGINTYTGGTDILDGVLRISQSENLGELGTLITFDGGALNTTASFSMIRAMALNAGGGTIDVNFPTVLDASGNITGVGSLKKEGDGVLQLSGFSTYEGGTHILGGEVSINSNINLGNSTGVLTLDSGSLHTSNNVSMARTTTVGTGGGAFRTDPSTTLTHSGLIGGNPGSAGVAKRGGGNLRWQGNNTFSGDIYLEEGRLQIDASGQLGNAANVLRMRGGTLNTLASLTNARGMQLELGASANTIEVAGGTIFTQSGVITDGVVGPPQTLVKTGSGELLLTASNTYSSPTQINQGTLRLSGSGRLPDVTDVTVALNTTFNLNNVSDSIDALAGAGDVTLGSGTLTVGADNGSGLFNGVISGSGGFVKMGSGKQTFVTRLDDIEQPVPNTYVGGTQINGGILNIELDGNLGNAAGPLGLNNGELEVEKRGEQGGALTTTRLVTLGAGGGTVDTIGDTVTATFSGVIGGPGSLTKEGLGPMNLAAANTYGGDTIIDGGLIRLQGAGRLPDTSRVEVNVSSDMTVQQGLALNNISDAINGLDGTGEVNLGSGTLTVGIAGGAGSFGGVILGTGGVTKSGAGTQVLSGINLYTGGTRLNGGVLEVPLNTALGDVVGGLTFDGGALRTTGSFTTTRATTLNNGGGTFETATGTTLTHNGPMSGVGGLTKSSAGTLAMGGINTYTGPTQINAGVLRLTGVERLADATDVTVAAGATLDLNNFNETFDSLSGAGSVALGTAQLVVGLNNGTGSFSGVISGTGDLLKEGTGVQTLSGLNTYSGATFVDRGELILNGGGRIDQSTTIVGFNIGSNGTATADGAGTTWDLSGNLLVGLDGTARMNIRNGAVMTVEGDVTIGSNNQGPGSMGTLSLAGGTLNNLAGNGVDVVNGVLQGHGSILGNVDNFSRVAPGNSAGILNVSGNFVQGTGATLAFEVGGRDNSNPQDPQFDVLDVAGNLGLDGVLELSLLGGFTPLASDTFTVVESGFLAGTFTNVANGARLDLAGGGTGSFQVNYGAGSPFGANLVVLSSFEGSGSLLGDFDGNGLYECPDVDALVAVIAAGSNNLTFDMNGDGFVNDDDLTEWLAVAGEANLPSGNSYLYGDATLDGAVDGLDFITWNANKFQPIAAWCSADFTADGFVDGQDLVIWNMNKFQSAGMLDGGGGGSVGAGWFGAESSPVSGSAMVPEPTSLWLIAVALWSAAIHRRFASKRD